LNIMKKPSTTDGCGWPVTRGIQDRLEAQVARQGEQIVRREPVAEHVVERLAVERDFQEIDGVKTGADSAGSPSGVNQQGPVWYIARMTAARSTSSRSERSSSARTALDSEPAPTSAAPGSA
jgi:hypothetical protein